MAGGEADLAQRSGKAETVKQPESERHEPRRSCGDAGSPSRARMISSATKAIESAIAASTGFGGTWTKPRVAAAKVMLCATVKAVMALIKLPRVPGNQNESEHEEQMIDAEQNVLDAELEIGSGDGPAALTSRDRCPRRTGRQSLDPFAAVGKLNRTSASVIVLARPSIRTS